MKAYEFEFFGEWWVVKKHKYANRSEYYWSVMHKTTEGYIEFSPPLPPLRREAIKRAKEILTTISEQKVLETIWQVLDRKSLEALEKANKVQDRL